MTDLTAWLRRDPPAVRCPACGHDNPGRGSRWCGWCGRALGDETGPLDDAPPAIRHRRRRAPAAGAVALVALVGLVVASTIRSGEAPPRGLTPRGDAGRSGQVALATVTPPTAVAWTAQLDVEPTAADTARTVAAGPDLVVTARGTRLVGLDSSSGLVRWSTELGSGIAEVRGIAVVGSTVTVVTHPADRQGTGLDGRTTTIVLDARSGRVLATTTDVAPAYPLRLPSTGPVAATEDLLLRSDARTVRAATVAADGTVTDRWSVDFETFDASVAGLLVATPTTVVAVASRPAGVVLQSNVAAGDALLVGLDTLDGSVRWSRPFPPSMPFLPIATDGQALVAGATNALEVVDVFSGETIEELTRPDGVTGVALSDTRLVVATESGLVVGSDRATRSTVWSVPAATAGPANLRVDALPDGSFLVYDRSSPGEALMLDGEGGETRGVVRLAERVITATGPGLVVADDGVDVVAIDAGGAARWRAALPQPAVLGLATDGTAVTVQAPDGTAVVDGRTGERLVSVRRGFGRLPADRAGGPVVTDGTTTVLSPLTFDGTRAGLVAIDALTGISRWSREGDAPTAEGPLTLSGDRVWLPVSNEVHGYALADGRRAYAARGGVTRGPLALTEDLIIAPAAMGGPGGGDAPDVETGFGEQVDPPATEPDVDGPLLALGRESRRPVWSAATGGCGLVSVVDDLVVVPTPQGVVARDLATGSVVWGQEATRGSCLPLTVARGRVVHVRGRTVTALSLDDGEVVWETDLARLPMTAPVAVGDEVVVADTAGTLQALALDGGAPRWQFGLPTTAAAAPVVVEGRLILLLTDGRLIALR